MYAYICFFFLTLSYFITKTNIYKSNAYVGLILCNHLFAASKDSAKFKSMALSAFRVLTQTKTFKIFY